MRVTISDLDCTVMGNWIGLDASGAELVTVALRRVRTDGAPDDILAHLDRGKYRLLPNTSGVRDAKEAVLAAEDARLAVEHGADGIMVSNHGGRANEDLRATIGDSQFGRRMGLLEEMEKAFHGEYRAPLVTDQKGTGLRYDILKGNPKNL